MNDYRKQVTTALEAIVVHSPTAYSWYGKESARLPPRIKRAMTPRTARNYLRHQLQSQLYSDFYVRGGATPLAWDAADVASDAIAFAGALSAANAGRGCCEDGWAVVAASAGEVVVRRNGFTLWVAPEDCVIREGGRIEAGTTVRLRLPNELPNISPGYYMALGNRADADDEAQPLVRVYWNLKAAGAAEFISSATRLLNQIGVSFRLKVLDEPRSYNRCDAAVIYLRRDEYPTSVDTLGRVYDEVSGHLKPATPAFTKRLAPGVGLAEDPGQAESFGQHRCRLLAEGMIRAYELRLRSLDARLRIVTECYEADGITLSEAFLGPGSVDIYQPIISTT